MHDKLEYEARYLPSLCHNASVNIFHSKQRQHRDDSIFVGKKSQWLKRCRSSWKLTLSCYGIYQDISILYYTLARTVLLQYFHRHIGCFSFYFDFFFRCVQLSKFTPSCQSLFPLAQCMDTTFCDHYWACHRCDITSSMHRTYCIWFC